MPSVEDGRMEFRMKIVRIIMQILRILLGIVAYLVAIYFFIAEVNRYLDFCPVVFHDSLENIKTIPFADLFQIYFNDFINMIYPAGVFAASTEIFAILRIFTRGMGAEIAYELDNHDYVLVDTRSGAVVGRGSDGLFYAAVAFFGRMFWVAVGITFMLILKPFILLLNVIKLIKMFRKDG